MDALEMATGMRQPEGGLIAHTDRGSQYTSLAYTDRLDELGPAPSDGSRGDAYDNAMAEAWVATFKSELVDGRRFPSYEHAEHEALHWIGFYNSVAGAREIPARRSTFHTVEWAKPVAPATSLGPQPVLRRQSRSPARARVRAFWGYERAGSSDREDSQGSPAPGRSRLSSAATSDGRLPARR